MNSHNISRKTSLPVFKSTRLLDQLREQIRYQHYSIRTEEAYVYWVKNFIHFHNLKHPRDMGQAEIEGFLTYLTVEGLSRRHSQPARYAQWPVAMTVDSCRATGKNCTPCTQPRHQVLYKYCL